MNELIQRFTTMRRPMLLIRAARLGMGAYRRERDLRRLIGSTGQGSACIAALFEQEEALETRRRHGDAVYSINRHIEVLIALMAELRRMTRPQLV